MHRVILFLLCFPLCAYALTQDEQERANYLFAQVKCMVCQGETIKESNSQFSQSLRKRIMKEILQGKSNEEILDNIRQRFGDEAVLSIPFNISTAILWLAPLFMLGVGGYSIVRKLY